MTPDENGHAGDPTWIENEAGTSNDIILSGCEAQSAKRLLPDIQDQLNRIDREILRMNTILDDLNAQREAIIARADRIHAALAPHKRLPTELLSAIFIKSIDPETSLVFPGTLTEIWPWPLRAVCSRWRKVAISDSQLWGSLVLVMPNWNEVQGKHLSRMLLSVAHSCTTAPSQLKISVRSRPYTESVDFQPFHLVASPQLSTRMTGLCLSLSAPWFRTFLESSAVNFSCLESLSLVIDFLRSARYTEDFDAEFFRVFHETNFFDGMRVLRKLRVKFYSYSKVLQVKMASQIPWHQLTDLDFSGVAQTAVLALDFLSLCRRLIICRLWIRYSSWGDSSWMDRKVGVTLPDLEQLTVITYTGLEYFFPWLTVPSLRELRMIMEVPPPLSDISSMICRSRASLEILDFKLYDNSPYNTLPEVAGLEEFLEEMHSVAEFGVFFDVPWSTLEKISRGELLPCLEVWKCYVTSGDLDVFIDALEDRMRSSAGACRLRRVRGWSDEEVGESARLERLQRIRETYGIDLEFFNYEESGV